MKMKDLSAHALGHTFVNSTICSIAALLLVSTAYAQNITQQNSERSQTIIASAVEAYGGSERLMGMSSLTVEHTTIAHAANQSRQPGPPWDRNSNAGLDAIAFADNQFVNQTHGAGGGFEFDTATIINGEQSYQVDNRAGTAAPISEPDFNTISGPFIRVTPALLVRQLNARAQTARYLGDTQLNDRPHSVLSFVMEVGPAISLYFDQETHLLNKSERIFPGFGLIEYYFHDYSEVDDIPFNGRFDLIVNGETNLERRITRTQINNDISALTTISDNLNHIAALDPDPLSMQTLADGVYLIGGTGTYAMFIEMDDYIIAVGGTAGIPDRITELRKTVPDKPIRYGVMTHHHNDHVLAVPAYAAEGATVIAAAAHADVVRGTMPDNSEDDTELKLETVDDRKLLTDGSRQVEIIDIGPTPHTEHLLVTYLPEEGILFEADHFAMPRTGPVNPAVSTTKGFAKAVAEHQLNVKTYVSAHSPRPGTPEDLRAAVQKPPANSDN